MTYDRDALAARAAELDERAHELREQARALSAEADTLEARLIAPSVLIVIEWCRYGWTETETLDLGEGLERATGRLWGISEADAGAPVGARVGGALIEYEELERTYGTPDFPLPA